MANVHMNTDMRLVSRAIREEVRRLEMEQLKAEAGMAGDGDYACAPPLRIDSLETTVDTLCEWVRKLQVSLNMPDRGQEVDVEAEKRLFSDAASGLEVKLIRMGHTIERCNFEITECVGAIDRIQAKIGS